jgi:hypothetical protein
MKPIQLLAQGGELTLPGGEPLFALGNGDVSVPQWPGPDRETLAAALYDAREMGMIPERTDRAELPNGEVFWFERFTLFGDEEEILGPFPLLED